MSDSPNAGFGSFVPGFDFLQNLAKGASQTVPHMPNLANWVSPSLNVEELEKRIGELKAVHFWLEQNSRALGATIQALEVQKMTLAALKGMNFNLGDVANAFKLTPAETVDPSVQRVDEKAGSTAKPLSDAPSSKAQVAEEAAGSRTGKAATGVAGLVDPLQLWGSLTQQFQQIAASAMNDVSRNTAIDATRNMAAGFAKEARKTTTKMAGSGTPARPAAKKAARRPAARKS